MRRFINVHTHLVNFDFFPDNYFKIRSPVREWMLRNKLTGWIVKGSTAIIPGKKYNRLYEMQEILKKDVFGVARQLLSEMDEAGIVMSVPLMMDLETASFDQQPETPYQYQVIQISEIAAKYPGRLMPFVMYDPRRNSAARMVERAIEKMGFLGVKMYPSLGYHPDPDSTYNEVETGDDLEKIFEYCEKNLIPITTHCSPGGSFSGELIYHKELIRYFNQPSSWEGVLRKYPKLFLNLAHFGGDLLCIEKPESWSFQVRKLMREYTNVFTDISYQGEIFEKKYSGDYFKVLKGLMKEKDLSDKILFGSDWSSTRHTWTEKEYMEPFVKNLPEELFDKIAFSNPLRFLFPGKKLPARISAFFNSHGVGEDRLPEWIKENLELIGEGGI